MEPPKVIIPLEDTQLKEGAPVLLTAKIIGKPTPDVSIRPRSPDVSSKVSLFQFVWLKDDQPLAASNRLRTRYDIGTKQVLLQINDVRPQDVGEYRVIATNPAGKDSTACKLNIIPDQRGVDSRPLPETQGPLKLKPIPTTTKPGEESKEPKRPPKVIVPLVDGVLEEQMPALFMTTIDAGQPMATVSLDHYQGRRRIMLESFLIASTNWDSKKLTDSLFDLLRNFQQVLIRSIEWNRALLIH